MPRKPHRCTSSADIPSKNGRLLCSSQSDSLTPLPLPCRPPHLGIPEPRRKRLDPHFPAILFWDRFQGCFVAERTGTPQLVARRTRSRLRRQSAVIRLHDTLGLEFIAQHRHLTVLQSFKDGVIAAATNGNGMKGWKVSSTGSVHDSHDS